MALAFVIGSLVSGVAHDVGSTVANLAAVDASFRVRVCVYVAQADKLHMRVVDGPHPLRIADAIEILFLLGTFPERAELVDIRHDGFGRTDPDIVSPAPHIDVHHAERCADPLDHRQRPPGLLKLHAADASVQEDAVHRVLGVLQHLEPVAGIIDRVGNQFGFGLLQSVQAGKLRDRVGRPHIGEDDALVVVDRIGRVAQPLPDAARRVVWSVEDRTVDAVMPAVIAAADALVGDDAVFERGTAMAAVAVEQSLLALSGPEQDEVLA